MTLLEFQESLHKINTNQTADSPTLKIQRQAPGAIAMSPNQTNNSSLGETSTNKDNIKRGFSPHRQQDGLIIGRDPATGEERESMISRIQCVGDRQERGRSGP